MKPRVEEESRYKCCRLVDSQRCSKTFRVASEDTQVILHIICNSLFRWNRVRRSFYDVVEIRVENPSVLQMAQLPLFLSIEQKRYIFLFFYEHKLQELDSWQSCSDIRETKQWIFIVCIWHLHDTVSKLPLLPATISAKMNHKIKKISNHNYSTVSKKEVSLMDNCRVR